MLGFNRYAKETVEDARRRRRSEAEQRSRAREDRRAVAEGKGIPAAEWVARTPKGSPEAPKGKSASKGKRKSPWTEGDSGRQKMGRAMAEGRGKGKRVWSSEGRGWSQGGGAKKKGRGPLMKEGARMADRVIEVWSGKGGENPPGEARMGGVAQRHHEYLKKGFGHATMDYVNTERAGTVELMVSDCDGHNARVRYLRDDGKKTWISMTEMADALHRMEDDQSTWLSGPPSMNAVMNLRGRAIAWRKNNANFLGPRAPRVGPNQSNEERESLMQQEVDQEAALQDRIGPYRPTGPLDTTGEEDEDPLPFAGREEEVIDSDEEQERRMMFPTEIPRPGQTVPDAVFQLGPKPTHAPIPGQSFWIYPAGSSGRSVFLGSLGKRKRGHWSPDHVGTDGPIRRNRITLAAGPGGGPSFHDAERLREGVQPGAPPGVSTLPAEARNSRLHEKDESSGRRRPDGASDYHGEQEERAGGPTRKKRKSRKNTDDPNDKDDPNYLAPQIIWWYTERLPNRWRGCRTWEQFCKVARTDTGAHCLAWNCDKSWMTGTDTIGNEWDIDNCMMSLWSHMYSSADREKNWDKKDQNHATENTMTQFLACYKRGQLAEKEKERENKRLGDSPGSNTRGSSSSSHGNLAPGDDVQNFRPPANIFQSVAGIPGRWASQGGWGDKSRF